MPTEWSSHPTIAAGVAYEPQLSYGSVGLVCGVMGKIDETGIAGVAKGILELTGGEASVGGALELSSSFAKVGVSIAIGIAEIAGQPLTTENVSSIQQVLKLISPTPLAFLLYKGFSNQSIDLEDAAKFAEKVDPYAHLFDLGLDLSSMEMQSVAFDLFDTSNDVCEGSLSFPDYEPLLRPIDLENFGDEWSGQGVDQSNRDDDDP